MPMPLSGEVDEQVLQRKDGRPPDSGRRRRHPIVTGGAIAGTLDILAAFTMQLANGVAPVRVLQAIASGALGRDAFSGGNATALLGLVLHFTIAFGAATVYYTASRFWSFLRRHAVVAGLAYGVVVYLVMQYVVLPLSRVNFRPAPWRTVAILVVVHMFCVGLPIALASRHR
jgi:hypothetical protein